MTIKTERGSEVEIGRCCKQRVCMEWRCALWQRSERTSAQRLCNLTSEVLHSLSHVYHHVSDLMVDMSRAPPRQLRAAAPMPTTAAIIQQTIPVHVCHQPTSGNTQHLHGSHLNYMLHNIIMLKSTLENMYLPMLPDAPPECVRRSTRVKLLL